MGGALGLTSGRGAGRGAVLSIRGRVVALFFFFQAEDGIRDYKVTGVQTCALPISSGPGPGVRGHGARTTRRRCPSRSSPGGGRGSPRRSPTRGGRGGSRRRPAGREIGRASCRERV